MPLHSNLTNTDALNDELLELDYDAVVHLAAISFVGHTNNSDFYTVNTLGTENLLKALLRDRLKIKAVLLASSANVYGNNPNSPISESESPAPINHYAISKLAMERIALNYVDKLPLFITRPFNYTGLGQSENFIIPKMVRHFSERSPSISMGNLHVEREFNDVEFICQIYINLLQLATPGEIYNICSGKTYTLQQILQDLTVLTGHHIDIEINPEFVRKNEVHRLCGNPEKLMTLLKKNKVFIEGPSLTDTLKKMLH